MKLREGLANKEEKPYVPKDGDLIDFQENKSKAYIPAVIKKITMNSDGTMQCDVSYFVANNNYM